MKPTRGKGATNKVSKEALKPVDDRKVGKRKAAIKADKSSKKPVKKGKTAKKDPNKPKRPASAFFVFLEEFRKTFKKENPNVKAVSAVGKAGGEKWKSMSAAEKAPYEAKAAKKKSEYEKLMNAYNKKQESMADDGYEEPERSKSEINDDDEVSGLAVPSSEPISKSSKAASPLSYPPVAVRHHLNAYHFPKDPRSAYITNDFDRDQRNKMEIIWKSYTQIGVDLTILLKAFLKQHGVSFLVKFCVTYPMIVSDLFSTVANIWN